MEWLSEISQWAEANTAVLWWIFGISLVLLLISPLVAGWLIVRLPTDYFDKPERRPLSSWDKQPTLRVALLVAKNLAGAILLLVGIIMIVTPGQGLLTILMGLVLLDFPGKYELQRKLVARSGVWRSINWLRKRAGKSELKRPSKRAPAH